MAPREEKAKRGGTRPTVTPRDPHRQYPQGPQGPEPSSELFCCPGCMRKLRGAWRYCPRCEAKRLKQGEPTPDGSFQLTLIPELT